MPKIRVDFSQATDFEAIPVGDYPMVLEETEVKDGTNYPYVNWQFKILTGEFAGRKQWLMTSTAPKAAWRLKETLKALGETDERVIGKDVKDVEFDPDDYINREAMGHVIQEMYDNVQRNKIEYVTALPSGPGRATTSAGGARRLS